MNQATPRPVAPLRLATLPRRAGSTAMYVAVLAIVLWSPLPFGSVEPWAIGVIRFSGCALLVLWAIHLARTGVLTVSTSLLQVPLYGAAIWALVQSVALGGSTISVDPFLSRQAAVTLLAVAVFVSCALVALDSVSRIERAAAILFWFGFALSVFAIIQNFTGTRSIYWIRESPVETLFGPFVNKNHFAGLIEILLPLGLGPMLTGAVPRERRLMMIFAGTVLLGAVALSRSRGGLLVVVVQVGILVALMIASRRSSAADHRRAPALAAVVAVVLVAGAAIAWLGAGTISESMTALPAEMVSETETSRLEIWKATVSLISAHPVTGSGIGTYGTAILPYWSSTEYSTLLYAHNDYLQVLADAGVVGALLAILLVGVVGVAIARSIHITDPGLRGVALGAGVGCIGLLMHSVVDFNLQIPSNAIAFMFAAVVLVRASSTAAEPVNLP